ncbi:hypothetical protein C8J56DRAFT_917437 [Mycena floridula]|nr:hypothetical protein C8J56DRAFT_917437 [Mycena floridula]
MSVTKLCESCGHSIRSKRFKIPKVMSQLRSGYVPADIEAKTITARISAAEHELARHEAEICRLQLLVEELEEQRDEMEESIEQAQSVLAPIRRLPVEVLTAVFEQCMEANPKDHHESDFPFLNDLTDPETLQISILSAVCSIWRQIAVATPKLWSQIGVNLGSCNEATSRILGLHLRNSRSHSLSLRIHDLHQTAPERELPWPWCLFPRENGYERHLKEVLDMMTKNLTRITRLVVYGYRWVDPFTHFRLVASWCYLEELELRLDPHIVCEEKVFACFFSSNLRQLTLEHVPIDSQKLTIAIGCSSLTSLTVSNRFLENILRLLPKCPVLEKLDVSFAYMLDSDDEKEAVFDMEQTIILQHLQLFRVEVPDRHDPEACDALFSMLSLPALQSIELKGLFWPSLEFISMLQRSQCTMQKVILDEVDIMPWALSETFSMLPGLTHLEWTDTLRTDYLDECIKQNTIALVLSGGVLPSLTHLTLKLTLDQYWDLPDLIAEGQAKHISLSVRRTPSGRGVLEELEELRSPDLELNLESYRIGTPPIQWHIATGCCGR